jgi:CBS domain-containing protein
MEVSEVMTRGVFTVAPQTRIAELAQLLAARRISGAPATERGKRLVGMVTEGDLLRRYEIGTDRSRRSLFERLFAAPEEQAREFVRTHGQHVADVMTVSVVSVGEADSLAHVADVFEKRRIKRAPVLRDGMLVGIVSRGDLVRALARRLVEQSAATADDQAIADRLRRLLESKPWAHLAFINFEVKDGVVELWGAVLSPEEQHAVRVAAEGIPGVKRVEDRLTVIPSYLLAE